MYIYETCGTKVVVKAYNFTNLTFFTVSRQKYYV
jgi:hypothetical protein